MNNNNNTTRSTSTTTTTAKQELTPTQKSRKWRFRRHHTTRKSPGRVVSSPIRRRGGEMSSSSCSPPVNCCLPRRKPAASDRRKNVIAPSSSTTSKCPTRRTVRFAKPMTPEFPASDLIGTRVGTPKLTRKRSRAVSRSHSRRSFYSVVSTFSAVKRMGEVDEIVCSTTSPDSEGEKRTPDTSGPMAVESCECRFPAHCTVFDVMTPIIVPPNVQPGSYEELLAHARAQIGNWITILDRSESLEPQMVHVGISKMKRMVMNRLTIPFTAVLEENDTVLHCWITTPVGAKHTTAGLKGQVIEDKDGDLGDWSGSTAMVDYSIPWFCGGKTVRALQMKRENSKLGTAYETRVCLPDKNEGRILLYNITIEPGNGKSTIRVDRIYKFVNH